MRPHIPFHLRSVPAHILTSILLDGTVSVIAMALSLVCRGVHMRRTPWRGGANFFLCVFGQSVQRGPNVCKVHFAANLANDAFIGTLGGPST